MSRYRSAVIAVAACLLCGLVWWASRAGGSDTALALPSTSVLGAKAPRGASLASRSVRHYEYVFPDGAMYVYDIDDHHRLVQVVRLPGVVGVRGVVASPRTHMLYLSYGAFGGPGTTGRLLAYNLVTGVVLFNRSYSRGIDSMAIGPRGDRIYLPDGVNSPDGVWSVIDARSGRVIRLINAGTSPHDTVVGLSGRRVYLGGTGSPYLDVASTATDRVIERVGPLKAGVRPFTINGRQTIAYTTASGFLGFQVSSLTTGHVLFTVTFGPRFTVTPAAGPFSVVPSHGISLTPNERQLWVLDTANGYVHVFDVSRVPLRRPRRIADIRLAHPLTGDGWLQVSRSGCFVYVGDSGEVLGTTSFKRVAFLPALNSTKMSLEIDWRHGLPVATSSRMGLGYVTRGPDPLPPKCN